MARTFRRQRQSHPIGELNLTNLIDLGFTLLIIFMIATPLINQEQTIPITLPSESKSPQPKASKDERFQSISIDRNGQYYWGETPLPYAELVARLRSLGQEPRPPVIRIRADHALQWDRVVQLMDELKKSNLTRLTFDTQTEG